MPSMFSDSMNMKRVKMNGKYCMPVGADIVAHHVGDELVGELGDRLQPRRHQRAAAHGVDGEERDQRGRDQHEQRRVGEGGVEAEQLERDQPLDLELMHGVRQAACGAMRRSSPHALRRLSQCPRAPSHRRLPATGRSLPGSGALRLHALGGPHHVEDSGGGAQDEEHHHQERRRAEPPVEPPADEAPDATPATSSIAEPQRLTERSPPGLAPIRRSDASARAAPAPPPAALQDRRSRRRKARCRGRLACDRTRFRLRPFALLKSGKALGTGWSHKLAAHLRVGIWPVKDGPGG